MPSESSAVYDHFRIESMPDRVFRSIHGLVYSIILARERAIILPVSLDHPSPILENYVIGHPHQGTDLSRLCHEKINSPLLVWFLIFRS
jgi:hypothetical protein